MSVSLYTQGSALIELGKYGMTLEEAKKQFLETAEKHGCKNFIMKEEKVGNLGNCVTFRFERITADANDPLWNLLHELGHSSGWCEYPPVIYILKLNEVPQGQYVRSGCCFK